MENRKLMVGVVAILLIGIAAWGYVISLSGDNPPQQIVLMPPDKPFDLSGLSNLTMSLTLNGYFVKSQFVENGTNDGLPVYTGVFTDGNNTVYSAVITQVNIAPHRSLLFNEAVSNLHAKGYSGNYLNPTVWVGIKMVGGKAITARTETPNAESILVVSA